MDLILWDICAFYRENEEPNQQIANTLLKEIQEVEQIKNDATSTERRVLGKLWKVLEKVFLSCFDWPDSMTNHFVE